MRNQPNKVELRDRHSTSKIKGALRFVLFGIPVLIGITLAGLSLTYGGAGQLKRKMAPQKDPNEMAAIVLSSEEEKQRKYMVEISRQMGVTCVYCHDLKNFKADGMKEWKVAKRHIDLVKHVNQDAKKLLGPKMDCFMCHRGEAKPDFVEPLELVD